MIGQYWLQYLYQLIQMRFVVAPQVDGARINWTPYLLRAGRFHSTISLVEAQTGRLEGQAAEVQKSRYLAIEIGNDILVVPIEYEARQHRMPMVHQTLVLQVLFSQFGHVVSKGLTTGKQLFE